MTTRRSGAIRCIVADDHPAVLQTVVRVLTNHGVEVVGEACTGEQALELLRRSGADIVVLDVRMPGAGGVAVAREIIRLHGAETGVVLYTGFGDRALVTEAVDIGVRGFVLKEAPLADLVRAIESAAAGDVYVDGVLAGVLASKEGTAGLRSLTARERDVLRLLSEGLTNEEIGGRLYISAETVRTHVGKAMRKLEADSRTHAVAIALRRSIIN